MKRQEIVRRIRLRPKAKTPFCWWCSKRLCVGGHAYRLVIGVDGHEHAVHVECVAKVVASGGSKVREKDNEGRGRLIQ